MSTAQRTAGIGAHALWNVSLVAAAGTLLAASLLIPVAMLLLGTVDG